MKTIVAATSKQAEAVARKLGLAGNEWRRARVDQDLRALGVDDIVVALPIQSDAGRSFESVVALLGAIEARDGCEAERVRAV